MRVLAMALVALMPAVAEAQQWAMLKGDAVRQALSGRTLAYESGATQIFRADGGTTYITDSESIGHWRVEGDRYCSVWPPSDRWTCYGVTRSADGRQIGFVSADGSAEVGRYAAP